MKVCLINPPTTDPGERSLFFPMALLTLGGVLKEQGVAAQLWDFEFYFKQVKNCSERKFRQLLHRGLDGTDAQVFGLSAICSNLPMALWLAQEIKDYRPDSLVMLGGAQPSSVPLEILERFDCVDIVIVGEGEQTLTAMAALNFDRDALEDIPGLAIRKNGQAQLNAKRPLVENMDDLPIPDYSLINMRDYMAFDPSSTMAHIEVGRGCPFNCTFCSTSLMWSKNYRVKSPARILKEMNAMHEQYGFTVFDFIHDNFTTSKQFITNFCDYMLAHNDKSLQWVCSSRTDGLTKDRVDHMHKAGLRGLFFGIETGSDRMQKIIKKHLNFNNFEPILEHLNSLNIGAVTAFILGFPEESPADIHATLRRALHFRQMNTKRIFFSKLTALAGTEIHRRHLPELTETSHPSTISPQSYGLPYIEQLIADQPDLFSSYYYIPHPHLNADELYKLIEWAHLLVNESPELALDVIDKSGLSALELFHLWDDWAQEQAIPYFDHRVFPSRQFKQLFPRFVDEVVENPARSHAITPESSKMEPCSVELPVVS